MGIDSQTLVFVKLGGSIITDKRQRYTLREENVHRLAQEMAAGLQGKKDLRLLIGHGAGSFGHVAAHENGFNVTQKASTSAQAIAQVSAATQRLHQMLIQILLEKGVNAISIHPSSVASCKEGTLASFGLDALDSALRLNMPPLIHGDVVADDDGTWRIVSTEELFIHLAPLLQPDKIILVGEVDGVFTSDPLNDASAQPIPTISSANIAQVKNMLGTSHGVDVTGGMQSKVLSLYHLVEMLPGLKIYFVSGNRPSALQETLLADTLSAGTVMRYD
jgi:isopentenyl phosphate kinase